jgi:hypothetical protein
MGVCNKGDSIAPRSVRQLKSFIFTSLHSFVSTTFSRKISNPKSYEHSPSPARRTSLGKRTSQCPKGCSFREGTWLSIQSIQGVAGIQDEVSTAAGTAGKQGQRERSRTGSGPRVAAHVARSRNLLKRKRAWDMGGGVQNQRPRKLVRASAEKSSLSISAQPLDLVAISDSELEPENNDDH